MLQIGTMDFNFDFDAPIGVLGDVLDMLRNGSVSLEESLMELVKFDLVDLYEHPQWQDLVIELQNLISSKKIYRNNDFLELFILIVVRFLQGLNSSYQSEDSLKLACQLYTSSIEEFVNENKNLAPKCQHIVKLRCILMNQFFESLSVLSQNSQGDIIEGLLSFALLSVQCEYQMNQISILFSSGTLSSLVKAILSFRRTSAHIILEETMFFPFLFPIAGKVLRDDRRTKETWQSLMELLLSICSTKVGHFAMYNALSIRRFAGSHKSESISLPSLDERRVPILNKLFSIKQSSAVPGPLHLDSKCSAVSSLPVWLQEMLDVRREFGSDAILFTNVNIFHLLLASFGRTACYMVFDIILNDILLDSTSSADMGPLVMDIIKFLFLNSLPSEVHHDTVLLGVVTKCNQFTSTLCSLQSIEGVSRVLDMIEFTIHFSSSLDFECQPAKPVELFSLLELLAREIRKYNLSERDLCGVVYSLTNILRFVSLPSSSIPNESDLMQIGGQSMELLSKHILVLHSESSVWSMIVELLAIADVVGKFPFFSGLFARLLQSVHKFPEILNSSRCDVLISHKNDFIWSMRQLSASLLWMGNHRGSSVEQSIVDIFTDMRCDEYTSLLNCSRNLLHFQASKWRAHSLELERLLLPFPNESQRFEPIELGDELIRLYYTMSSPSFVEDVGVPVDMDTMESSLHILCLIPLLSTELNAGSIVNSSPFYSLSSFTAYVSCLLNICGLKHTIATIQEIGLIPLEVVVFHLLRRRYVPYLSVNEATAIASIGQMKGWILTDMLIVASILQVFAKHVTQWKTKGIESFLHNSLSIRIDFHELIELVAAFLDNSSGMEYLQKIAQIENL